MTKIYGKRKVVNNVSLEVKRGEIVGLLGPNGAGKTTTFYMIMGIVKPNQGKVFLDNIEITNFPMYKRANLGVIYLPQEPSIFKKMSVWDNIYSLLELKGFPKEICIKETEKVLKLMGIYHLKNSKGYMLSGGERRRLEIARSLAMHPSFLLLDEPFTGIDPKTRQEIQDIIVDLRKLNMGILITDHNVRETLEITDRSYIIYEGKIFKEGKTEDLINDPILKKIYLGDKFKL